MCVCVCAAVAVAVDVSMSGVCVREWHIVLLMNVFGGFEKPGQTRLQHIQVRITMITRAHISNTLSLRCRNKIRK